MTCDRAAHHLWFFGVLLLLLALLTGAAIPALENARMGLSAHLTGIECSLVLIAFGFLWSKLRLSRPFLSAARLSSVWGTYALWLAFVLGAALGTSRPPMAGAGFEASHFAEMLVGGILFFGVAATFFGTSAVLVGIARATFPWEGP